MELMTANRPSPLHKGGFPSRAGRAFTLWFTGLPASGKSTLAQAVSTMLKTSCAMSCEVLDGDAIRATLSRDLRFSREDRIANTLRIGMQASLLVKQGIPALIASIAPYRDARLHAKQLVEAVGGPGSFIEIFVDCPIDICSARDAKGLYAKARAGLLTGLSGVDDPYEAPEQPDLHLRTDRLSISEAVRQVLECLAVRTGFGRLLPPSITAE